MITGVALLKPRPLSLPIGPSPTEAPPPYSPLVSPEGGAGPAAVTCRVCGAAIGVEGKGAQHVVRCGACGEATVGGRGGASGGSGRGGGCGRLYMGKGGGVKGGSGGIRVGGWAEVVWG